MTLLKVRGIFTLVVFVFTAISFGQDFAKVITVTGANTSYDLRFGFSAEATDEYDADKEPILTDLNCNNIWNEGEIYIDVNGNDVWDKIDEYAPPQPPPPTFDAALDRNNDRFYSQILAVNDALSEEVWNIVLQYPVENIIELTWNNTGWSSLGSFILQDAFGGTMINIDMVDLDPADVNAMAGTLDITDPENPRLTLTSNLLTTLKIVVTPNDISAPKALFTADEMVGAQTIEVSFEDQSIAGSAAISSWLWDFGDGTTSNEQNPSHIYTLVIPDSLYSMDEEFSVSLTITDANGVSETTTKEKYIYVGTPPTADFVWAYNSQHIPTPNNWTTSYIFYGQEEFTDLNNNDKWDEGEQFTDANNDGIWNGTIPGSSSFPSDAWSWDFDKNGSEDSDNKNPERTFGAGVYTVTLTVTDNKGLTDSITKEDIIIYDGPKANFSADMTDGMPPLSVQFTEESSFTGAGSIVSWKWDFDENDGLDWENPDAVGQNVSQSFDVGIYSISLLVTDNNGNKDIRKREDYIEVGAPTADFNATPMDGTAPLIVTFTNLSDSASLHIWSQTWVFGDRIPSSLSIGSANDEIPPDQVYNQPGAYPVKLTILAEGAFSYSDTKEKFIVVTGVGSPTADFTAEINSNTVDFNDISSVGNCTLDEWRWNFGDDNTSDSQNPSHTYDATGSYTVELIVVDRDSLAARITHEITIETLSTDKINKIVPDKFTLMDAFPNPFNPETTINFTIAEAGDVKLIIYDILGREINTLVSGFHTPNTYSVVWNGTNDIGEPVSTGVYFYKMVAADFTKVKKVLLLK